MSIIVNIQLTGESGGEITNDLKSLLNGLTAYKGEPIGDTAISSGVVAANGVSAGGAGKPPSGRTRQTAAEKAAAAAATTTTGQGVSTGEDRVDPAANAQDAADEAADSAATKPVDLTHDDVKKLLGAYVMAYGMDAAQSDGTAFLGAPKLSEVPNTQKALAAAIIAIAKGIQTNPNKRELVGDGLSVEKTAELKPIVAAAMAVK